MENWRKYNNAPFDLMCEQYDKKLITEDKLADFWKQETLREFKQLNEIDWEKEAELTADPNYKPPQERPGMLAKLQQQWEKINNWILEKSVQLVELARRSAMGALKSISWLLKKIKDFCSANKTLCKVIFITLMVIAFYIAFTILFENEAQAKLYRGNKPMSDTQVNSMKGYLYDVIDSKQADGGDVEPFVKLMTKIDEIHNAKGKHDILKAKDGVDRAMNTLFDGVVDMWKGTGANESTIPKETREKTVVRWIDIGSRVKAWYRESTKVWDAQTIDIGGQQHSVGAGSVKDIEWGMSLAKQAAKE
jgi:hypothetical protein